MDVRLGVVLNGQSTKMLKFTLKIPKANGYENLTKHSEMLS